MKIRPVEAELLIADERTDRRTDMTKLIVSFRNFSVFLNFFYILPYAFAKVITRLHGLLRALERKP